MVFFLTMPKKVKKMDAADVCLASYSKRQLPRRGAHKSNQYAPAKRRLVDVVDDLLAKTPTVDEIYRANSGRGLPKRGNDDDDDYDPSSQTNGVDSDEEGEEQIPRSKWKKSPAAGRKSSPTGRYSATKGQKNGSETSQEIDSALTSDEDEDEEEEEEQIRPTNWAKSPAVPRKTFPKGRFKGPTIQKPGRRSPITNSILEISSTDTTTDIQQEKEMRRVQDADRRKVETSSNKIINNYRTQVQSLRDSSKQKEQVIGDLQEKLDKLQQDLGLLQQDNARVRSALLHVRNNPGELIRQVAKKKAPRKKKSKRSIEKSELHGDVEVVDGEDLDVVKGMLSAGKDALKMVYRTFKFINNDPQEKMFLELMLNNLGKPDLLFQPDDSDERKAQVEKKRKETCDEYGDHWIHELNVHRTYVQAQSKKALFEWVLANQVDVLPETEVFMDYITTRDFSRFDIKDDDSEDVKRDKEAGRLEMEKIMDLYTDKLVPAVAGPNLFHPKIRHFEPMTTAKMPPITGLEQLRIPASTEAMTIVAYANNRKKWQSMLTWRRNHPGMKFPRYSEKRPTINVEFKEEYSSCSGSTNKWGGWSDEGRKLFNRLQAKIYNSRLENLDRHVKVDKECVARLYATYKDMHGDMEPLAKKQKKDHHINLEDDRELDFIIEV